MKKNKKMLLLSILLICMCIIAPTTVEAAPKISSKKVTMYVGNTKKLKVSGTKSKIKWSSSNKNIATVNSKGKVLAKKAGKVKINAKVDNKTLKCSITVKNPYLNYNNLSLKTGESMQLSITGTKAKNWTSSDTNIVTVSDTGCVTCVRKGSATITCTGANKKTYKCYITVSEPECKHTYNKTVTKQPTCEEDGTAEYTCSLCGDSYTDEIEKTDHSYAKSVVNPTCTEKGYDLYTCAKCQKTYKENYTDTIEHDYVKSVVVEHTCEEDGTAKYTCSVCGDFYSEPIGKTDHSYAKSVVNPTCTEKGYDLYTCAKCQKTYKENYTDTIEHDYVVSIVEPTCEEDGATVYTCNMCGDSYSEPIGKTFHSYTKSVVEPTCEEKGYDLYTCDKCQKTYKENYADATGHSWDDGTITEEATCSEQGVKQFACAKCLSTYKESLPVVYHSYILQDIPEALKEEATCKKQALYYYSCKWCKEINLNREDYLGTVSDHTYNDEYKILWEPNYTDEGMKEGTCTYCGTKTYISIPRNDYVTGVKMADPKNLKEELSPKTRQYLNGLTKGLTEQFYIYLEKDGEPIGVDICYSSDEQEVINSDGEPMMVNSGDIVFQIDGDANLYGEHLEDIEGLTTVYEDKLYLYIPELCELLTGFGYPPYDISCDILADLY